MKLRWDISTDRWDMGIASLRKKTYIQKKYHFIGLIEQSNPLSQFLFYGTVTDRDFFVSPVVVGINRIGIALSGELREDDTGTKMLITVTIAPGMRKFIIAVLLWIAIGLCWALIVEPQKMSLIPFVILYIALLAVWLVITKKINDNQSKESILFLENAFKPENMR